MQGDTDESDLTIFFQHVSSKLYWENGCEWQITKNIYLCAVMNYDPCLSTRTTGAWAYCL